MKKQKILEERIRRVKVLFLELGYTLVDEDYTDDMFTCEFKKKNRFLGGLYIDSSNRFLEIAYTFSFSHTLFSFLRSRIEEMFTLGYNYGCYSHVTKDEENFYYSVYTKIYYSGLSYHSLNDTLKDFFMCINDLTRLLDIDIFNRRGE
ncbi:MAG: hypothetical protein JW881_04890 [Spirochaetales bacterium]|nr:hypothetical protein [Spirochaetales bacterium]